MGNIHSSSKQHIQSGAELDPQMLPLCMSSRVPFSLLIRIADLNMHLSKSCGSRVVPALHTTHQDAASPFATASRDHDHA